MENNDNKSISDSIFKHDLIKKICVVMYFVFLICFYASMFYVIITSVYFSKKIDVLYIILMICSMLIAPFVFLLLLYPIYALAHLCQKSEKNNDNQKEIELLITKLIIDNKKSKTELENKGKEEN